MERWEIETGFVTRLEKWGENTGVIVDQALPNLFLLLDTTDLYLEVHVSTLPGRRGFWGLSPNRLDYLRASGREWLVALLQESPETGYLLPSAEVIHCTRPEGEWPLRAGGQHKIHQPRVSEEFYFKSFHELAERLGGRIKS